jgi:hypothetical protein
MKSIAKLGLAHLRLESTPIVNCRRLTGVVQQIHHAAGEFMKTQFVVFLEIWTVAKQFETCFSPYRFPRHPFKNRK